MDEIEFIPALIILRSGTTIICHYRRPNYIKALDYEYAQDPLELKDPMFLETFGVSKEDKSVIVACIPHSIYSADSIVRIKQEDIQLILTPTTEVFEIYKSALADYRKESLKFTSAHALYKKYKDSGTEPPHDPNDPRSKIRDIFSHRKH